MMATCRRLAPALLAAALLVGAGGEPARALGRPGGPPADSLQAAIDRARPGDVLEVLPGTYAGPIVIDKPLTVRGIGGPVIDGGGAGTVVTLAAPDIVFSGFEVRNSGSVPDRNDAGVLLTAPRITVSDNRLAEVLVGVFVSAADGAVVRGNDITGKEQLDQPRKGDAVRVWYSRDVVVEANHVHDVRDVVLWYSERPRVRGNTITGSRYGIHLMFSDGTRLEDNRLLGNSVGIYVMYSRQTVVTGNLIRGHRGPSGYAVAFKDSDEVEVRGNVLADDRVGIFLDGTPFSRTASTTFEDNILAFNDIGVLLQPSVRGNRFQNNTFWENTEQVTVHGGGGSENLWVGNAWSDYAGFDAGGDGVGDLPHHARRLFDSLAANEPRLRMILHSPAAQALDFAAAAFPIVRPVAVLTDPEPRLTPAELPAFARQRPGSPEAMILAGGVLAALALLGVGLSRAYSAPSPARAAPIPVALPSIPALEVTRLTKRYGRVVALDDISLVARAGEALALWGPNGAGKTTLLNSILGVTPFEGQLRVLGMDLRRHGREARRRIGYVPQTTAFYDAGVLETVVFFARLRRADPARQAARLEAMGLGPHLGASVSTLSGGMRQRLALAVALIGDPPVLLMDEPTANLDVSARADHRQLLAGLRQEGRTLIFATHRLDEIEAGSDRVAVLERGRLIDVLDTEAFRLRFTPEIELSLQIAADQQPEAFRLLERAGYRPRLSGRGSLVLRLSAPAKMGAFEVLRDAGVPIVDFTVEQAPWT